MRRARAPGPKASTEASVFPGEKIWGNRNCRKNATEHKHSASESVDGLVGVHGDGEGNVVDVLKRQGSRSQAHRAGQTKMASSGGT